MVDHDKLLFSMISTDNLHEVNSPRPLPDHVPAGSSLLKKNIQEGKSLCFARPRGHHSVQARTGAGVARTFPEIGRFVGFRRGSQGS